MKLVDTSSWVHQMRPHGEPVIKARVDELLRHGEAAWCPPVRLELWAGVRSDVDRRLLRAYGERLPELPITDTVWHEACELGGRCRHAGKTAPPYDILIAACARHHGVALEHTDAHFEFLMTM